MSKALIVIDVQEKYMDSYEKDLIVRINDRIRDASDEDIPVIYVRNMGNSGNDAMYELSDNLLVVSGEIFEKHLPSAFTSVEFVTLLRELSVIEIELIGVDGSSCVAKTAFDAVSVGYNVSVNLNCVSSINSKFFSQTIDKMVSEGIKIIRE